MALEWPPGSGMIINAHLRKEEAVVNHRYWLLRDPANELLFWWPMRVDYAMDHDMSSTNAEIAI
jgi:hypothetical protein